MGFRPMLVLLEVAHRHLQVVALLTFTDVWDPYFLQGAGGPYYHGNVCCHSSKEVVGQQQPRRVHPYFLQDAFLYWLQYSQVQARVSVGNILPGVVGQLATHEA